MNRGRGKDKDSKEEVVFCLRLPPELYERLKRYAEDEGRSMNAQLVYWIKKQLDAPGTGK
jgi:hypothetical protein